MTPYLNGTQITSNIEICRLISYLMAEGYHNKDDGCTGWSHNIAVHGGAGGAGVRLHTIGVSARRAQEFWCTTAQEGTMRFYGILFDL